MLVFLDGVLDGLVTFVDGFAVVVPPEGLVVTVPEGLEVTPVEGRVATPVEGRLVTPVEGRAVGTVVLEGRLGVTLGRATPPLITAELGEDVITPGRVTDGRPTAVPCPIEGLPATALPPPPDGRPAKLPPPKPPTLPPNGLRPPGL